MKGTLEIVLMIAAGAIGVDREIGAEDTVESIGGDSIDLMDMLGDLEDKFSVSIDDGEIDLETTFGAVVELIETKLAA